MQHDAWDITVGDGPLVAAAIHDGHEARPEVAPLLALGDSDRLREEDPFTAQWTTVAPTRIIGLRSRFEVDLNRPREKAVYISPLDAWGLTVWKQTPPSGLIERSLAEYDRFYAAVRTLIERLLKRHQRLAIYDLHTYNHRRQGPQAPPADWIDHPEVNVGTGTLSDRRRWASVIDRFIGDLSTVDFLGRKLDVRENIKFRGGEFARTLHADFPEQVVVLSIEFKKFFMDEWTGEPDHRQIEAIGTALQATTGGMLEELARL